MSTAETQRLLLREALDLLYRDAGDLIENCSLIERDGEETVPREGTMEAGTAHEADELLDLIRRIEETGLRPLSEQPAWLIDVVQERRKL